MTPERNTVTDLYIFQTDLSLGMTMCAPLLDPRRAFSGALCNDIIPSGALTKYFTFGKKEQATYMLFNTELPEWEEGQPWWKVLFGIMTSDIDDEDFNSFIKQIVGQKVIELQEYETIEIKEIKTWRRLSRIYGGEHLTWGKVTLELGRNDSNQKKELAYWFTVADVFVDYRNFS
jgi:hypothetical protein